MTSSLTGHRLIVSSFASCAYHLPPFAPAYRMRFDLKVPFAEKNAAKKLGARWDAVNKLWYMTEMTDMAAFAKWNPTPRESASAVAPGRPAAKAAQPEEVGKVYVGSKYVERPRVCACLPWDVCDKCRATALSI